MLTPYGKEVRKLRIERGETLKSMAGYMGVTSAYLSAVETGKKRLSEEILQKTIQFLGCDLESSARLRGAAEISASEYKMNMTGHDDQTRETVAMFARSFSSLPEDELARIRRIMEKYNK